MTTTTTEAATMTMITKSNAKQHLQHLCAAMSTPAWEEYRRNHGSLPGGETMRGAMKGEADALAEVRGRICLAASGADGAHDGSTRDARRQAARAILATWT